MSRILLTGGAGFIGSHVTDALARRGDEVTVLDNFNDFYDPSIKRANAARSVAEGEGRVRIVEGDIRDQELVGRLFEEGAFDALVHLAAMAGVRPSLADPLHYQDVNVRGTYVLLTELEKRPETKFVFASSSSVYGAREDIPFGEADDIHCPVSPYAATKRAGELVAYTHHHLYGIPTFCLRFFTVYGPRQRPEMAIHKFVRATLAGEAIPFFGDGSTRRDYTFIEDIVDGVLRSVDRCEGYDVFNLGDCQTTSLAELVAMIGEVCGTEPRLEVLPMQPGDMRITCASIDKARERLGYDPGTPIRQGLERFVDWYRGPEGPGGTG